MRKQVCAGVSVLLAASMLAGCGSGGSSGNGANNVGNQDTGNSQEAAGEKEAGGREAAGSGEKTVMTMTTLNGGTNDVFADCIQEEVDRFNAENEYNVEIKLECYSNDNYKTKITTLMASNAQPDIFFTWESGFLKPFVDGGKVYPVGDLFAQDTEWYNAYPDKSVFGPLTFDDQIWAIPNMRQTVVVAYNHKLFQEAGVEVPSTYQEFLSVCEGLKNAGIAPFILPCGEAWYAGQLFQQLCNGIGGEEFYQFTISDEVLWNDARFVEAGTMLKELADKGYLVDGFLGMSPSEGFERFNNGGAAMLMCITSGVNKIDFAENEYYDDIDFFLLPSDNPENNGVNVGSIGQTYAISSQAENPEAAAAFLKQLSTGNFQQVLTDNGQVILSNTEVNRDNLSDMIIRSNKMFEQMKLYTPWLDRIYGAGEGVEFNNAAVSILGGTDPQEAMDNLQQFAIDNASH